jgi:hypothetical protein
MTMPDAGRRRVYRAWMLANALGEACGLGTTFVLGALIAPRLEAAPGVLAVLVTAVVAIVLGTVLEGVVVGVAQEVVLRRYVDLLRPRAWTIATAAGAGLAWTLGMAPSTFMALAAPPAGGAPMAEPSTAVTMLLAAGLGLVAGPILGAAQWVALRRVVDGAGRWLWANALAWAVGMPIVFLGMDLVPWTGHPAAVALAVYAVCGVAGLAVGAVHGRVLLTMLDGTARQPASSACAARHAAAS